jgi:hypothetical protein
MAAAMWTFFLCHLCGHDYGMDFEPGAIFLRCVRCRHRSPGWALDAKAERSEDAAMPREAVVVASRSPQPVLPPVPRLAVSVSKPLLKLAIQHSARVLPFTRSLER